MAGWLAFAAGLALAWAASSARLNPALASQAEVLATPLPPAVTPAPTPTAQAFADWHLPLPAGKWAISRGPCDSAAPFDHDCGYYEERCALDLVSLAGSMEDVPVLAPQAGEVFFEGTRNDGGMTLMVRHADGRVSDFMHLARVVVALDEWVEQGQVIGYAGSTGSSGHPHLHFVVQPSAVERECLDLKGLDELHIDQGWAVSKNRAWRDLTLPDPPALLPGWLPMLSITPALSGSQVLLPARLWLTPGQVLTLPVVTASGTDGLTLNGFGLKLAAREPDGTLFALPIAAPAAPGVYTQTLQAMVGARVAGPWVPISYTVRPAPVTSAAQGIIRINPQFLSPGNWARVRGAPRLCWREESTAGGASLRYRVLVVGPASSAAAADSGWISATCWQAPDLKSGLYQWKAFVRDGRGYMNRTNQRPQVFAVR